MRAGALRHRLTFQQLPATPQRDSTGAEVEDWQDVATVWGSVEPLTGRELFTAQQLNATLSHRVRLRYLPGITPKMRIQFGPRYFLIDTPPINREERNIELELLCTEVV